MANGVLKLDHNGGYIIKYYIHWYSNGKTISWENNGKNFTAPYDTEIDLKDVDGNVYIKAQGCTGLAWEWWRTNYENSQCVVTSTMKLVTSGTTLSQKASYTG